VHEARAWLEVQYERLFTPPFNEGSTGAARLAGGVEGMQTNFAKPDAYPVDGRGVSLFHAYFRAKQLGTGQFYLMTIVDKAGRPSTAAVPIA